MTSSALEGSPRPGLEAVRFDNRVLRSLPLDPVRHEGSVPSIPGVCFSPVQPTPVANPQLVAYSPHALRLIGIQDLLAAPAAAEVFAGNQLLPGSTPAAHCYCGHQFGSFAGQLGDGAAIYLGEALAPVGLDSRGDVNAFGKPISHWELQLKGAGPTPYSRSADGRKVLRSSLREFVCSEHMHALGIPTTRAGTLVTSDSTVERDPVYNGRVVHERCSIVSRLAPSFLRFGSFQICDPPNPLTGAGGPSYEQPAVLQRLFDVTVSTYFAEEQQAAIASLPSDATQLERRAAVAVRLLEVVTRRTAALVARWQSVGFCHGVLNTDNMSILGLTIDYGPYGFVTHYDEGYTPNHSDSSGRYAFSEQPMVCKWNLLQLAQSLSLLFVEGEGDASQRSAAVNQSALVDQLVGIVNEAYEPEFQRVSEELFRAKLGLVGPRWTDADVRQLRKLFFATLRETQADLTEAHHRLSQIRVSHNDTDAALQANVEATAADIAATCPTKEAMLIGMQRRAQRYRSAINPEQVRALLQLADTNPEQFAAAFRAPRELVLQELRGELEKSNKMNQLLGDFEKAQSIDPLQLQEDRRTRWKEFLGVYQQLLLLRLDPSTDDALVEERIRCMAQANPVFVLRPWVLQDVIAKAEKGNYSIVQELLDRAVAPFREDPRDGVLWGAHVAPPEAASICVSCSS